MIVYFAFNTVTEMSYVGATKFTLDERKRSHYNLATDVNRGLPKFAQALLEWPPEFWEWWELETCATEEQLDEAEQRWQRELHTLESGVGYNSYDGRYLKSLKGGERRRVKAAEARAQATIDRNNLPGTQHRLPRKLDGLSIEEKHEFFRQCGLKALDPGYVPEPKQRKRSRGKNRLPRGAWQAMSDEERRSFLREAGRKGAVVSKEKLTREILSKKTPE